MTKNFHYELGFLIDANIPENEHPKTIQTVKELLLEKGANIISEIDFGRKKLNYPIKKSLKASFFVFEFTIEAKEIKSIEQTLKLEKAILRFLTTKKPHNIINQKPTEVEPQRNNNDRNDRNDNKRERPSFDRKPAETKKPEVIVEKEDVKEDVKIEEPQEPKEEIVEEVVKTDDIKQAEVVQKEPVAQNDLDKKLDEILNENKF